jgi:16S rRNA (guanine966-N2)-methyltransferase
MRISGGAARGILLQVPRGDLVRPATDALRQAVFSSLGGAVVGARFWDLFAGSGAYGLEALSRGAAGGVFIEKQPKVAACIKTNLAAVARALGRPAAGVEIVTTDALMWTAGRRGEGTDLVFIDPPYDLVAQAAPILFARLSEAVASKPDAIVVLEAPGGVVLTAPGWTCVHRLARASHQPAVAFFRRTR